MYPYQINQENLISPPEFKRAAKNKIPIDKPTVKRPSTNYFVSQFLKIRIRDLILQNLGFCFFIKYYNMDSIN